MAQQTFSVQDVLDALIKAGYGGQAAIDAIHAFEQKYPDTTDAFDQVLAEIGGLVFTPQNIAAQWPVALSELIALKGGLRPQHHASDGGA